MIIELKDVTVPSRRDPHVGSVEHVNWTVQAGEFWVVGGLQGAGKSDLIFLLGGLTHAVSGVYRLFGQEVGRHFGDEFLHNRLRTGVVFDDSRLLGTRSIAENVALPIRYHQNLTVDECAGWVETLLKETDVIEFAEDHPTAISQPWRRRVALARALALRPEVLFLENPLRGLDARHAAWWVDIIARLWHGHPLMGGRPMTVIASTDEYRQWRNTGAQFARLEKRRLQVIGAHAPAETRWDIEDGSSKVEGKDEMDHGLRG